MEADGEVTVLVGTTELGQAARHPRTRRSRGRGALDHAERVTVRGTTPLHAYDRSTGASRSTTIAGLAVQRAAPTSARGSSRSGQRRARRCDVPRVFVQHFGLAGGELIGRGEVAPEGTGSYAEGPVFWENLHRRRRGRDRIPRPATCAVLKTATIADVGIAINPQLVERQDEGGTMQGSERPLRGEGLPRTARS